MFEILTKLIIDSLSKIIGKSVEAVSDDISRKRSLLSRLIDLYDSVHKLEIAAVESYRAFSRYADGSGAATKTVIDSRLRSVREALDSLVDKLRQVETLLNIYDPMLIQRIARNASAKGRMVERIDLAMQAAPSHVILSERETHMVEFPTLLPATKVIEPESVHDFFWSGSISDRSRSDVEIHNRDEMGVKRVDMQDAAQVKKALAVAEQNILDIRNSRTLLGQFIRNNFSLEQIAGDA